MRGRLEIPGDMDPRVLDDFVVRVGARIANQEADIVERRIRLIVQEKPRWWPEWLYRHMLHRLLKIEVSL